MMGATTVSTGAAGSGYYKTEGYYLEGSKEGAEAASWFGEQAKALGLDGRVDDEMFSSMLTGQTYEVGKDGPVEGRLMGRYTDGVRQHRPGIDLTFSAPKDVSVAALVYGDERLIAAHDAAVKEALGYIEQHVVQTRRSVNGELEVETGGKIIAGIFRHDTSRAMDPQLHSHAVVANMVRNSGDEYTAVHNNLIFKSQKMGSEIYRASLAKAATELGYTVERYGKDRLISLKEIPDEVADQFSKRRDAILNALEERGDTVDAKTAERAALATRARKAGGIDRDELRQSWHNEAKDLGLDAKAIEQTIAATRQRAMTRLGGQTRDGAVSDPAVAAVEQGIAHISENSVSFGRKQLIETALKFGKNVDLAQVETAVKSFEANKALLPAFTKDPDDPQRTTEALIVVEKQIVTEWRASKSGTSLIGGGLIRGSFRSAEGALENKVKGVANLSEGQRDAIIVGLTGKSRFVGVQGSGGTGKTYMLSYLNKYAEQHGLRVEGLAPSNRAVEEMRETLPNSETLQARLLRGKAKGTSDIAPEKTIVVVDEASMITNDQALKLMRQAREGKIGRVIFLGDTQQLDGVGAGTPFDLLQKSGMRTAVMDDIIRQRDENIKSAVGHAIKGDVEQAFSKLNGLIITASKTKTQSDGQKNDQNGNERDKDAEKSAVVQTTARLYLEMSPAMREQAGILTPANKTRSAINEEVREGLKDKGEIGDADYNREVLTPLRLSIAERSDARSYSPGDVVIAHQSVKTAGLTKGHIYEVADRNERSVTLTRLSDGETFEIVPTPGGKVASSLEVFERDTRDFSLNERVKFRIGDKDAGIENGMRGTITDVKENDITIDLGNDKSVTLPRDSLAAQGMDQAHALTVHDMQGASVKHPIMALSSQEHFANQKSFYVGVSRSVETFALVTDNVEKLMERITAETGAVPSALESYVEGAKERSQIYIDAHAREKEEAREAAKQANDPDAERDADGEVDHNVKGKPDQGANDTSETRFPEYSDSTRDDKIRESVEANLAAEFGIDVSRLVGREKEQDSNSRNATDDTKEATREAEKTSDNTGSERDRPALEIDPEKRDEKTRSIDEIKDEIDRTFEEERAAIMKELNQKVRQERER
ncbi:relaxase domain-containing protein [bacterium]|nr:relaxase domain-containing protein [bacterium]